MKDITTEALSALLAEGKKPITEAYDATPQAAFDADAKVIKDSMAKLEKAVATVNTLYLKQLKDNPSSWAGLGDGGDYRLLRARIAELAAMAESQAKNF